MIDIKNAFGLRRYLLYYYKKTFLRLTAWFVLDVEMRHLRYGYYEIHV